MTYRANDVVLEAEKNPDQGIIEAPPYLDASLKVKDHCGRHDLAPLRGKKPFHLHNLADGLVMKVLPSRMADRKEGTAICGDQLPRSKTRVITSRRPQLLYQRDRKSTRLNSSHANISYA